jgi:hypothetical protein
MSWYSDSDFGHIGLNHWIFLSPDYINEVNNFFELKHIISDMVDIRVSEKLIEKARYISKSEFADLCRDDITKITQEIISQN